MIPMIVGQPVGKCQFQGLSDELIDQYKISTKLLKRALPDNSEEIFGSIAYLYM